MKKLTTTLAASVALLGGCSNGVEDEPTDAATSRETSTPSPVAEATESEQTTEPEEVETEPQVAEESPIPIYEIGERFEFEDSALTIEEVEVSDTIETKRWGAPGRR